VDSGILNGKLPSTGSQGSGKFWYTPFYTFFEDFFFKSEAMSLRYVRSKFERQRSQNKQCRPTDSAVRTLDKQNHFRPASLATL
jgi:hypothetical protein